MYKKFTVILMILLFVFVLGNFVVWHFFVKSILVRNPPWYVGDLARVGYLPQLIQPRQNVDDLPRRHLELADYDGRLCEVVTIGDSFSNGMGFGPNRYYQDFIASRCGVDVLNLPPLTSQKSVLHDIACLANSQYLQKVGAKYLILQIAERNFLSRANMPYDDHATMSMADVEAIYDSVGKKSGFTDKLPDVSFINTGNIKFIINQLGFLYKDKSIFGDICKVKLTKKVFNHRHGNELVFLAKDIRKANLANDDNLKLINENLNKLSATLAKNGIKLCVVVAPNKYSVYAKYIEGNKYPVDNFSEKFRQYDKNYYYLDLYDSFAEYVDRDGCDLYYIDDTHWSHVASSIFADRFAEMISRQE